MPRQTLVVPGFLALASALAAEDAAPPSNTPPTTQPADILVVEGAAEDAFAVGRQGSAAKFDLPEQQDPQSRTTLPRDLLDARGAWTLREALRSAPGVTMAAGEGGRTGDSLSIRGFAANSDLYVDGLKDNGQYFRDTFATDHVEVLRGAAGVLFGRGSTGGVVNTVTRKPTDQWTGDASVTAGAHELHRVTAGMGGPVGDALGVRLDAVAQDSGSFRDEQHLRRFGIAPAVALSAGDRTTILLQGLHQQDDGTMDYGVPMYAGRPAEVPVETYYGFKDDSFQTYDVNQATLTIEHRLDSGLTLRNATRYGDYRRNYRTEILGAVNYGTDTVARSQALRDNVQRNLINQSEAAWQGQVGGRDASLLLGLELSRERYEYRSKDSTGVPGVAVFDPRSADSVGAGRADDLVGTLNARNETTAQTVAGYALGSLDLVPALKAVLGLRVDCFAADYSSGPTVSPVVTEFSRSDTMVSPRTGLVWTPVPELSTYASWSRAYNPSAETYSLSTATSDLEPEQTDNYEVGAKAALFDEALTLGAAVFRLDKSKARTVDPNDTSLQVLDGRQRTDGIEFEAAGTIGRWSVQAGVAFMDAEVLASNNTTTTWDGVAVQVQGKRPINAPRSSGSLWTSCDLGRGFVIGTGFYAVGSRFTDQANSTAVPGYIRFDATLGWQGETWSAQLNLQNLADTVHYETGSARSAYAGTPLTGQLTLGARF
jgi:catecholate siderophore receptor